MTGPRPLPSGPPIAFYGDNFTGSSASMEATAFAGVETVLFLHRPTPERLEDSTGYRAIGGQVSERVGAVQRRTAFKGTAVLRSPQSSHPTRSSTAGRPA